MLRNCRRGLTKHVDRFAASTNARINTYVATYNLFARSSPTCLAVVRPGRILVPRTHSQPRSSLKPHISGTLMQKPKPVSKGGRHFSRRRMASPSSVYVAPDSTDIGAWSGVSFTVHDDCRVAETCSHRFSAHSGQLAVTNVVATIT